VSLEALLATGYAVLLIAGALALEWLSAHTHRRPLRFRTATARPVAALRGRALPSRHLGWPVTSAHIRSTRPRTAWGWR
jgi:hypothetical protein